MIPDGRASCTIKKIKASLHLVVSLLVVVWLTGATLPRIITQNLLRLRIVQGWMSVELKGTAGSDALQDGIPDEWDTRWWGGARSIYRIEEHVVLADHRAARVERTNVQGIAALEQSIPVVPTSHLVCTVYAKGAGGAIQFQFRTGGAEDWESKERQEIPPSDDWQQHRLSVSVPAGKNEAQLRLRSVGLTWFDEAYVGVESNGQLGPNLLRNPGFERDGISEDPLEWWQSSVTESKPVIIPQNDLPTESSYLNILDMLAGRYEVIRQRARQLGDRCGTAPEMTMWLIARGDDFEQARGVAARERLYQLAIELAPNCPQPYAALARLYESHRAFWRATELYYQAAELVEGTVLAGEYYYSEGVLHVKYTGDTGRAIFVLQKAEQLSGWESARWDWGAASLYLGQALEAEERLEEAAAAYQRVIDCERCSYRRTAAHRALQALSTGKRE